MQYDDLLRGKNGAVAIFRNSTGNVEEIIRTEEPVQGATLKTTVDAELQEFFYSRMLQALLSLGRTSGAGIALNPQNGDILALISFPSFDGDNVSEFLNKGGRPLFNRAVSGVYSPGSTIKPIHAAAALQESVVSPGDQIYSAGYIEIPNPYNPTAVSRFVDWKAHGWVDVYSALARSSNVYFYVIGGGFKDQLGLGIARLYKYWQKFDLDEPTGIDVPGEAVGFLPTPEEKEERTGEIWRVGDTYNVSIGQGDLGITPLRLITAVSAIANGGPAYTPHIREIPEKQVLLDIKDMAPALAEVRRGMADAVKKDYGTANLLKTVPMLVGAKTGSAQVAGKTKTNALITAYASRDENTPPEIAILILVEDAREGSLNTVPVARDILQWYYDNRVVSKIDGQ
jgi:penicillin-binding protein 2